MKYLYTGVKQLSITPSIQNLAINYNFKLAVIAKLNEFTNGTKLHKETTISKEEAMEVARVARTVKKILLEKRSQELIDTQFIHNTHEDWQIIT